MKKIVLILSEVDLNKLRIIDFFIGEDECKLNEDCSLG